MQIKLKNKQAIDFVCDRDFTERIAVDMVTTRDVQRQPFECFTTSDGKLVKTKNFPHHIYNEVSFGVGEVLERLPESEREFDVKKNFCVQFVDTYNQLIVSETDSKLITRWLKRRKQISECANRLIYKGDKLANALFCKVRLCPMCSWRRAIKICIHTRQILEKMMSDENQKFQFLFLTLTIPNVTDDELPDALTHLLKSWRKMTHQGTRSEIPALFNENILGWYRGLEVTRNMDEYEVDYMYGANGEKVKIPRIGSDGFVILNPNYKTWHPHFHCILVVPADANVYDLLTIRDEHQNVIKESCFLDWWKWATGDNRITQVDCRMFRPAEKILKNKEYQKKYSPTELLSMAVVSGVVEAAKYTVKTTDYYLDDEATKILDLALERRQLVAYGGIMSKYRDLLKLDDELDGDLIASQVTEVDADAPTRCYAFSVGFGCYIRTWN